MEQKIKRFLDDRGRLKQVPSKSSVRKEALQYLSDKFDDDKKYTEKECQSGPDGMEYHRGLLFTA
jgi:hypothetical protein